MGSGVFLETGEFGLWRALHCLSHGQIAWVASASASHLPSASWPCSIVPSRPHPCLVQQTSSHVSGRSFARASSRLPLDWVHPRPQRPSNPASSIPERPPPSLSTFPHSRVFANPDHSLTPSSDSPTPTLIRRPIGLPPRSPQSKSVNQSINQSINQSHCNKIRTSKAFPLSCPILTKKPDPPPPAWPVSPVPESRTKASRSHSRIPSRILLGGHHPNFLRFLPTIFFSSPSSFGSPLHSSWGQQTSVCIFLYCL